LLAERAGEAASSLRQAIIEAEAEGARVTAAQLLRTVDQSSADPEHVRGAKRIMGIAVGRFSGHYLTERLHGLISLPVGSAVEAAFLCGRMADGLGLDLKIARRAALMHDIGKALTHELDGSHAVIGADYARRLGESEIVANAIGAHHTDEPFSSPYAYLVAAADAMSGARPGARRQMEDNYVAKLADLERLSRGFAGVEEAFTVQGGREIRVYVREDRVDDLGAVKLSSDIAEVISREMTFPGQITVTVIREFRAIETAS